MCNRLMPVNLNIISISGGLSIMVSRGALNLLRQNVIFKNKMNYKLLFNNTVLNELMLL